ncbi:MAG: hypothetical protein V9E92_07410 [Methylotenera sp.]
MKENIFESEIASLSIINTPLKKVSSNEKNASLNNTTKLNTLYISNQEYLIDYINDDTTVALLKAIDLNNSSSFDVHTWSEYHEVNHAVDYIYKQLKSIDGFDMNSSVRKKHVKVVVLDLYVKWLTDPSMYSSYYRGHWYYHDIKGRYNKLFISKVTIKVVDALEQLGYLTSITGHYGREEGHSSHMARMRATDTLISLIKDEFHITLEMVDVAPDTECIVMRDVIEIKDKKTKKVKQVNIPYEDTDYPEIVGWRFGLTEYNNLLRNTYIDIPDFPKDGLITKQRKTRLSVKGKVIEPRKIYINRCKKFIKRIFNNNNWQQGGRFYGGWWQRVPSEWRSRIRIWNMPVSEVDYKGLHIVLLYLLNGLEYQDDPYFLDDFEATERMRNLLKLILLSSINAKDKKEAIKAIRQEINFNPDDYSWTKDIDLDISELLDAFVVKHKPIEKFFFTRRGIELQYIDSRIAEKVINHFTKLKIPVLCVHDSFVITADKAQDLLEVMRQSFLTVLKELKLPIMNPKTTQSGLGVGQWSVILSDPHWRDYKESWVRERYDYPEWNNRLTQFIERKFENYYQS